MYLNAFLTSTLGAMSGQLHAPAALLPWEITPGTRCIGGLVGPTVGLDAVE
jgi:hypothetical protein